LLVVLVAVVDDDDVDDEEDAVDAALEAPVEPALLLASPELFGFTLE
jgi:hypothetical protein